MLLLICFITSKCSLYCFLIEHLVLTFLEILASYYQIFNFIYAVQDAKPIYTSKICIALNTFFYKYLTMLFKDKSKNNLGYFFNLD